MRISAARVAKSLVGMAAGAVPGIICWTVLDYGPGWSVFIGVLGMWIGLALTLPGVSARRVVGKTVEFIVTKNADGAWGEKAYQAIAKEPGAKRQTSPRAPAPLESSSPEAPAPESSRQDVRPASTRSAGSAWWWVPGLVGLSLTCLGGFWKFHEAQKRADESRPKPLSPEKLKELTRELQKKRGLDPIVLYTNRVPKRGQPDSVEFLLLDKLNRLRKEPQPDPAAIQRLERSLEYWRERKKKEQDR
jgi:hypothetical protein